MQIRKVSEAHGFVALSIHHALQNSGEERDSSQSIMAALVTSATTLNMYKVEQKYGTSFLTSDGTKELFFFCLRTLGGKYSLSCFLK